MKKLLLVLIFIFPNYSYSQGLSDIGDALVLLSGEVENFYRSDYFINDGDLYLIVSTGDYRSSGTRCINLSKRSNVKIKRLSDLITLYIDSEFYYSGYENVDNLRDCKKNKNYSGGDFMKSKNPELIIKIKSIIDSIPMRKVKEETKLSEREIVNRFIYSDISKISKSYKKITRSHYALYKACSNSINKKNDSKGDFVRFCRQMIESTISFEEKDSIKYNKFIKNRRPSSNKYTIIEYLVDLYNDHRARKFVVVEYFEGF